ncbi:protein CUSTOS isoform X2 [Fukomys damarensis]|uniref:protein CUSTOS isoform X2 n=1 Tax=Fukomys damarensis TaxID=885580 RepID=UPI00053F42E7|nr:protein CUSTOS isoform X2 [Fukomys damarensis]
MAAPSDTRSDSESSSSSDAEELARCREAAMPAWGLEQPSRGTKKTRDDAANNQLPTSQPSLRHKVDEHEQDGNKLQTTPEFRAHVARKLSALLDSSIIISEAVKEPRKAMIQEVASGDNGFRLFFTSLPRDPEEEAAPRPCRKRQRSGSSEDSTEAEEWQRCREAAVSANDILQDSAIHSPVRGEQEAKKKKKKAKKVVSLDPAEATTPASGATVQKQERGLSAISGDQVSPGTKNKKRKKKAKANKASSCPLAKSTTAVLAN